MNAQNQEFKKHCQVCGETIFAKNKQAFRRLMYCDNCRKFMKNLQNKGSRFNGKEYRKAKAKLEDERLNLLNEQNSMLKKENELLKEAVLRLQRQVELMKK